LSVIGIGTDIIDIRRIEKMADNVRDRLAQRVLTASEYQHYSALKQPARYLAKRWAGKEAASKALGTGIAAGVSFQHFNISSNESGKPLLDISATALDIATKLGAISWHISLADEEFYATAFVVLST
jgi:holo-[acyl-carrier protein] synthase